MSKPTYRRLRSAANYLLLLSTTVGAYVLYNIFVTPYVQPVAFRPATASQNNRNYENITDTEHHAWFRDTDWERQPCAVLLTSHGKILFQDFERTDPKTWIVTPFSMVLNRKPDPDNPDQALPPIVLRCEKGARLKLDQPISAFSQSAFLETAELEGDVEMYRRKSDDLTADDLRIQTSNVQIDHQTVTTIDDVAFWFGSHQGMGRQMTLTLSHTSDVAKQDFSAINGITNLRLALLSSMQLNPPQKKRTTTNRMLSSDNAPVQIQTNGDFEFDFQKNLARFRNQVRVRKLDQFGDQLDCDELLLKFSAQDGKKFVEIDAADDNQYELETIVAKGAPALLTARSQNAQIKGEILKYELANQFVQATSNTQVSVLRLDTQFIAKSIQYVLTDDGKLGQLTAVGPGHLIKQDPNDPFRASWAKLLTIQRKNDQQHLIQLQGKAKLNLGSDTELSSNRINLTVWEVPVFDWQGKFVRWTQQPAELNAKKRVHISSEKLIADADELVATWPANPQQVHLPKEPENVIGRWHRKESHQQLAAHMGVNRVRRVNFEFVEPEKTLPLLATGKLIQVSIKEVNSESKISDMQILGDVQVKKPSAKQPNQFEFTVTGNSLHMVPQNEKNYQVQVTGSDELAQIISDRFHIEGEEVFLDQQDNLIWINGNGRVILVQGSMAGNTAQETQARNKMNVRFAGGMIFDGRNIYFEYGIKADIQEKRIDGSSKTKASGNALKITLDRLVRFENLDDDDNDSDPQIVEMIFRSAPPEGEAQFQFAGFNKLQNRFVTIENEKRDASGQIVEKFKLNSPHAVLNRPNDQLSARGPGGIEIYRKGKPGKQSSGFGFVGDPAIGNNTGSITYVHTHFDEQLVSGIDSKNLTVTGNIRSLYAPVENFDQRIDPSRPKFTPEGTVRLFCDQINLIQSKQPFTNESQSQFIATGNAQIAADRFASQGDRISFRDDTENLIIESLSGKNVVLRLRNNTQSKFDKSLVGTQLIYNLRTKTAEAKGVDSLSASINKRP